MQGHAQSLLLQTVAEELLYKEVYEGEEPYYSRILANADYLRMDYGEDEDDFVLYDRNKKQIFNIVHDSETVLRISNNPVTIDSPMELYFSQSEMKQGKAHTFMGHAVSQHRYMSKATVCRNTVSVNGPMAETLAAMREFYMVLAGQQAQSLASTPKELLSACDLTINTFHPIAFLEHGLPLRVWDANGMVRELVDLKESHPLNPELFDIPKGYRLIEISALRGDNVSEK